MLSHAWSTVSPGVAHSPAALAVHWDSCDSCSKLRAFERVNGREEAACTASNESCSASLCNAKGWGLGRFGLCGSVLACGCAKTHLQLPHRPLGKMVAKSRSVGFRAEARLAPARVACGSAH